ncbi:MAG TPA: thiamine pyrophosphate-dependent enzyme [Bacteroidales bacterium]|nr:thiamine pyrophosphate-dependent enzyme [Bacteroidales bacterium]HPR57402.1 thiamine pyrophosphate-dependent enzyme [Bacteroidales bacterium]
MNVNILKTDSLPFCKGCGHELISKNTAKALEKMGYNPLDVIMVTDIGCHGIIDRSLNTHTIHGLHGRSVALGAGIAFGNSDPSKKIIVFIGDGGATIGLQHIMEAARLNINMSVIIHNNMLYGMTGGQSSGLTPEGFHTTTSADGNPFDGYDICALSHTAGASYVARISGIGDISDKFIKAFQTQGFSLIEVVEICTSYGVKFNPGRKLNEIIQASGRIPGEWINNRLPFTHHQGRKVDNLFAKTPEISKSFNTGLEKPLSLIMSGSAGEGVQLAATIIVKAAMKSGLHATQKGSYPVTVGVGFSTAEVNLSPKEINFHGINVPDIAVITSAEGLAHSTRRIGLMKSGTLFIDQSLTPPVTGAKMIIRDFRDIGYRTASLFAVMYFIKQSGIIPLEAVFDTIESEGLSSKIPVEKLKSRLEM